jgi:hypothetical protein
VEIQRSTPEGSLFEIQAKSVTLCQAIDDTANLGAHLGPDAITGHEQERRNSGLDH